MNSEEIKRNEFTEEMPQRAVSLYGQTDGVEDFPVLKAFQQYIDAEQEKARKRIVGLGICFGIILIVVIVVFMVLLYGINTRNQALSDRLVEYAMESARQRTTDNGTASGSAQNDAAIKAMTATLQTFQKALTEKKDAEGSNADKDGVSNSVSEKLERSKALLAVERQRLAVEKERLHQIEVEQQRRRLYPEFYEKTESESRRKRSGSPSGTRNLTDEDIREIIREAYSEAELKSLSDSDKGKKDTRKRTSQPTSDESTPSTDATDDDAIEYFKDDDYTIPVDVRGTNSRVKFSVPVE